MNNMDESNLEMELPGFRFHPNEEELLDFYLKNMVFGNELPYNIIGCLNLYRYEPWDLPGHATIGEREWYFFVARDTRHGSGGRPNRTTEKGFWKATGSDKKIYSLSHPKRMIGLRKTLVFYKGRAPRGTKTDWVMNEYRLPDSLLPTSSSSPPKNMVLCKIYRKATSLKVLEQRAAVEEEMNTPAASPSLMTIDTLSCTHHDLLAQSFLTFNHNQEHKQHNEDSDTMLTLDDKGIIDIMLMSEEITNDKTSITTSTHTAVPSSSSSSSSSPPPLLRLQSGKLKPSELELPTKSSSTECWTTHFQDPFWAQLRSPFLHDLIALTPLPNLHNF